MAITLNADRINHADLMARSVQMRSQPMPPPAGSFHAGVNTGRAVPLQPAIQPLPARLGVREGVAALFGVLEKDAIELVFGDVDAENR